MKKLLVCGGRDYKDRRFLYQVLDETAAAMDGEELVIVHGGANGADTLAGGWARSRGRRAEVYQPDRKLDGLGRDWKFRRNERMLRSSNPDAVLAFPGGPGTAHTVRTASAQGYPIARAAKGDPHGSARAAAGALGLTGKATNRDPGHVDHNRADRPKATA